MREIFSQLQDKYINACLVGDLCTVEYMIKQESKKIKTDYFFTECFNNACKCTGVNNIVIVKIILKCINVHSTNVHKILYIAFESGNTEIINIVKSIPSINGYHMYHGLIGACSVGRMDIFLEYEDSVVNSNEVKKMSKQVIWDDYMFYACDSGNNELVNYFINKGANNWNDCLRRACTYGHIEIIELMISKGANCWNEALQSACFNRNKNIIQIVELMISKGATDWGECMKMACMNNQTQIIEICIANGATNWNECMNIACAYGHGNIVEFMILKGATDWNGGLGLACIGNKVEIVKLMIKKGATNFDDYFRSPYIGENSTIIQLLIENGANGANGANNWNKGLRASCFAGNYASVKLMLEHGATNLNECLKINQDHKKDVDISNILISKGANDLQCLINTEDFKLYQMYSTYKGTTDVNRFLRFLIQYPPYVLFVGSRCKGSGGSGWKGGKCSTKRLPVELFRFLHQF